MPSPTSPTTCAATWSEYDARAHRLAAALVGTGLPRGVRVAVLLPDGVAVHVAFVAAERAGVTIVGLGHRAGDAEIRHILGKTGARRGSSRSRSTVGARPRSSSTRSAPTACRSRTTSLSMPTRAATSPSTACPVPGAPFDRGRRGVRRRRSLHHQLDVGHHRAAQVRAAQPEPLVLLPPARGRGRRLHERRRVLRRGAGAVRLRAVDRARHARDARRDHRRRWSASTPTRRCASSNASGSRCSCVREHAVRHDAELARGRRSAT